MYYRFKTFCCLMVMLSAEMVEASDPQRYDVTIKVKELENVQQTLKDVATLIKLKELAPVDPFALVARAQSDQERFYKVLRSFGYYQARIRIQIAGFALDDSALFAALERTSGDQVVNVDVSVEPGPLYHLRKIDIQGNLPETFESQLGLSEGAPALANDVLAAREKLLHALQAEGYAQAKVDTPIAFKVPNAAQLDIVYPVESGARLNLGTINFQGLTRVNESFVRQRLLVKPGDRFDPIQIEKNRRDLASLGIFSSVQAKTQETLDANQNLVLDYRVVERPPRALNVGASFYTDLGGSLSVTWQHRNLFGNAEQLNLTGAITQLAGNSTIGIGYNLAASFIKPDYWQREQSLQTNLRVFKQHLIAYDQIGAMGDVMLQRKLAQHWSASLGLAGERSQITQDQETHHYTLLNVPILVKYDSSNSLMEPTAGIRAALTVTPTKPLAGQSTSLFLQTQLSASTYFDFTDSGRSVLALRGLVVDNQGVGREGLPPDKRAYAGGSATVRGYSYQSIGPRFSDNKPKGGSAMSAATLEFRQRFLENWGMVGFVDVGQVSENGPPFASPWRLGVGTGVRYYTSFGPIRVDLGLPVNPQPDSGSFELYVSLGQAF